MTIRCHEVVAELWDYLDGELPAERAAAIADHLAECARCYPRYRFEYAFLESVARQRARVPSPSAALVARVREAIAPNAPATPGAPERRRSTPRAAAPIRQRAPSMGLGGRTERWALLILRVFLGVFLLLEIGRRVASGEPAAVSSSFIAVVTTVEGILAAFVLLGVWRRWSYGAALLVHVGSLLLFWGQLHDPWGVAIAGLPACGALISLYLLRDRDTWALDARLAR